MEGLQARLDSFKKSKRVKNPTKSSTTSLKWPHPSDFKANPATLAEAGFFYDPSYDDPDNVTCFYCGKQLAGWEDGDDPYLIHWNKCASTCCWAVVQCGLKADMDRSGKFTFKDENRLPDSKAMEKARLETFNAGKGWIHDKNKSHRANSKSMARAGFAYTPQQSGDDLATCLYCNISLSGWDDDDDPLEEHRKRSTKSNETCPFFERLAGRQSKPQSRVASQSTKPPSKSQSKPPSRSTSRTTKNHEILVPTKTFDGELQDDSDAPNAKTASRDSTTKTPAKPRSRSTSRKSSAKTPAAKSRSTSRSGLQGVIEVEEEEEPVEAPPTVKKKPRSRSKSVARSEITAQSDDEEITVTKTIRKPSRSRAKSRAPIEVESEADEPRKSSRLNSKVSNDANVQDQPRKVARKSSKPKVVQDDVRSDSEEATVAKTKEPLKTGKTKRTVSRSKSKVRPPPAEEESEVEEEQGPDEPKSSQPATMKAKVGRQPETKDVFDDDVVMDDYVPPPSTPLARSEEPPTELPPLFIPKRTTNAEVQNKDSGLSASTEASGDRATPASTTGNDKEKEKRKPGRPPKVKPITASSQAKDTDTGVAKTIKKPSKTPAKQVKRIVEVSSDEEEVTPNVKAAGKLVNVGLTAPPRTEDNQSLKDDQQNEQSKLQDNLDVSMDNAQDDDAKHEAPVTDVEMEMHTAPSTPPRLTQSTLAQVSSKPHTPPRLQVVDNTPDNGTTTTSGTSTTITVITPEPLFVPPLSRLPFMPLHTLSEAELDMTVEEWIRYQIEVEQDRFKRDGERELEKFKKRAEEVRKVIEGL